MQAFDLAGELVDLSPEEIARRVSDAAAAAAARVVPDYPTLSDWRVALTLWGRLDDVTAKVATLISSTDPAQAILGKIARERLEYANTVTRAQLTAPTDAAGTPFCTVFGFTLADVDESLWRARQVGLGDLSGTWPLSAG